MSGGPYGRGKAPERCCMPSELWPLVDRERWQNALTPADIFNEDCGARAHLSAASNRKTERGYGRYLTYCAYHEPGCLADDPCQRVTAERVKRYVARLSELGNSSQTILDRLQEMGDAAKVMQPGRDFCFINRVASRIRARHKPARSKSRIIMSDELAQLGYDLMERVSDRADIEAAITFRDGLMIALLAYVPLRRKNFTSLSIGRSLVHRQGQWFIALSPAETKTHAFYETTLPAVLVPWLELYLKLHRPTLAARSGRWQTPVEDALWVSAHGSPATQMAVYDRIRLQTSKRFGQGVCPHRFRDAAASTLATSAPQQVRVAAPLLGHRSFQTTEKYYRHAMAQLGHRKFIDTMEQLRGRE